MAVHDFDFRKIAVFLVAFAAVLAVYFLFFHNAQPAQPPAQPNTQTTDIERLQAALDTGNAGLCAELEGQASKDFCFFSLAANSKNAALCERVVDSRDNCFVAAARAARDASICNKVVSLEIRERCFVLLAEDLLDDSLCDNLSESSKDGCLFGVAVLSKKTVVCEKIADANIKDNCNKTIGG